MIESRSHRQRTWALRAIVAALLIGGIAMATFILAGGNGPARYLNPASTDSPLFGSVGSSGSSGSDEAEGAIREATGTDKVTVSVNGDMLWHEPTWTTGTKADGTYDFTPIFEHMKPIISGSDMAICHNEVPFAPEEGPFLGYPQFQAPPQIAPGLKKTGWDFCTTASNHSVDHGFEGLTRTLDVLDQAGIGHTGMYRTEAESEKPAIYTTASGVKIGIVSGTYGTNGLPVPEPWMVDMLDTDRMIEDARKAKEAGADIVMAAMHAGDEYAQQPNAQQIQAADELTKSEYIDVVYGHHAHVVQPIEKVNGKWVVYGLGNLVAQQMADQYLTYEGITVEFTFGRDGDGWKVDELKYIPTMISPSGHQPVQVAPTNWMKDNPDAFGTATPDAATMEASLERTREVVNSRGAADHPEVVEG
ncbi:CapA family protein [Corynebacterium sp. 335C]